MRKTSASRPLLSFLCRKEIVRAGRRGGQSGEYLAMLVTEEKSIVRSIARIPNLPRERPRSPARGRIHSPVHAGYRSVLATCSISEAASLRRTTVALDCTVRVEWMVRIRNTTVHAEAQGRALMQMHRIPTRCDRNRSGPYWIPPSLA